MTIKRNRQLEVSLWTAIGMLVAMYLLLGWVSPWVALCASISLGVGCCFFSSAGFGVKGHLTGRARE